MDGAEKTIVVSFHDKTEAISDPTCTDPVIDPKFSPETVISVPRKMENFDE